MLNSTLGHHFNYMYDGLEPPIVHTKFQGIQPLSSGVEDF